MPLRPLLYVAAPYTNPDPVHNVNAVCRVATEIYDHSLWVPLVPHTTRVVPKASPTSAAVRPKPRMKKLGIHAVAPFQASDANE